jgi:hypothetical protein
MIEMLEEWENNISFLYTRKFTNKTWKTIKYLAYLLHVAKYNKILNENLKEPSGSFF